MRHRTLLRLLLAFLFGGGLANAAPITYTDSAIASGSLGGNIFTNSLITLTFTGDTANLTTFGPGIFLNQVGTLVLNVASLGTATFTDAVQAVDNQPNQLAGFGDNTAYLFILGTKDGVFSSYSLNTSVGPITDASVINPGASFGTDRGAFIINTAGNSTFTASVTTATPEPASMALLGLGLAGITGFARCRRRPETCCTSTVALILL